MVDSSANCLTLVEKPSVKGKFLFSGTRKIYIRGVTYGTFRCGGSGDPFPDPAIVKQDFAQMKACGFNAVRVYTPPPIWLLDLAWNFGLYVMVGLPWEQHIAFLDQVNLSASIEKRIRSAVRLSRDHPAVLCYVVGNEIPASIVRWHGRRRIERFIHRLYKAVKEEAPDTLVTYVNYPTTEYLDLPFLDFVCFNLYLESAAKLQDYLAQLQNLAGDRPLVMAEIGLDSRRNGVIQQAETLDWQIRTIFAAGCAGLFVFAWTDEWHRGGYEVEDWDFGLTTRNRTPKPALAAVGRAFQDVPFPRDLRWPCISVIVCTYNGARTLRDCLEGLRQLEYPDYEIIVVDDGSTDDSAAIAEQYPVRLIRQNNEGLSGARNTGMEAARGEIIAYIDDDAWPDPHWLHYLAWTYMNTDYAAVGGPNIPPTGDGPIAECVANSPGGPAHVMINHRDAEHIPGCNCSFITSELRALGGFDKQFRTAGDDVDVCWRLLKRGRRIGFHAGAMVWHHRRRSVRAYLKQQAGYGKAEVLLEAKWPEKYTAAGCVKWAGRVYGNEFSIRRVRARIYQGYGGTAPFQRLYMDQAGSVLSTPDWYVMNGLFAGLLGLSGRAEMVQVALLFLGILWFVPLLHAFQSVAGIPMAHAKMRYRALTALLHVLQPLVRSWARFSRWMALHNLFAPHWRLPRRRVLRVWSEHCQPSEQWLELLEERLRSQGTIVCRGNDYDAWDLEVHAGLGARLRVTTAIEEHGNGKQMVLIRLRPAVTRTFGTLFFTLTALTLLFSIAASPLATGALAIGFLAVVLQAANAAGAAAASTCAAIQFLSNRLEAESRVTERTGRVVKVASSLQKMRKTGEDAA